MAGILHDRPKAPDIVIGGKGKHARLMGLVMLERRQFYAFHRTKRPAKDGFAIHNFGNGRLVLIRDTMKLFVEEKTRQREIKASRQARMLKPSRGMDRLQRAGIRRERRIIRKAIARWKSALVGVGAYMAYTLFRR